MEEKNFKENLQNRFDVEFFYPVNGIYFLASIIVKEKLKISRLIRDKSIRGLKSVESEARDVLLNVLTGDRGRRYYHNLG